MKELPEKEEKKINEGKKRGFKVGAPE